MNNRQKAKHFKMLYERLLPQKSSPVIHETFGLKHYRMRTMVDEREILYRFTPYSLEVHIQNEILKELIPLISANIKSEKDIYRDKIVYSLDVWM